MIAQNYFPFPTPLSLVDEDYATDWSTDSCGWSEEEAEAECGATDPFLSDDSTGTGTRGSEIVRCVCEVEEDNDFMIQVNAATLHSGGEVVTILNLKRTATSGLSPQRSCVHLWR